MKYLIYKYYSAYSRFEIEADNEDDAWEKVKDMPPKIKEILLTLEDWEECNEIELV